MKRKNIIAAIFLIALGIGYGFLTDGLPERTLPHTPPPAFFPWVNTVILLTLSFALLVQGLFLSDDGSALINAGTARPVIFSLTLFFAYLLAFPVLGFVAASIPFFAGMMVLYGETRPAVVAAGSIGVTVMLFSVFRYGFGVLLPLGVLDGVLT